jgi:hypothetical protein
VDACTARPGRALDLANDVVDRRVPSAAIAEAVVEEPGSRLGEDAVGLRQVAEVVLRVGRLRDVGVGVTGGCVERAADRLLVCVLRDTKELVVIRLHRSHNPHLARIRIEAKGVIRM